MFYYCYLVNEIGNLSGDAKVISIILKNGQKLFVLQLVVNFEVNSNVITLNSLIRRGDYTLEFVSENPIDDKKLEEILTKKYI